MKTYIVVSRVIHEVAAHDDHDAGVTARAAIERGPGYDRTTLDDGTVAQMIYCEPASVSVSERWNAISLAEEVFSDPKARAIAEGTRDSGATIPIVRATSADTCHCGCGFDGSDHCPFCGCEQYERYCDAKYPRGPRDEVRAYTRTWVPGSEPDDLSDDRYH